MQINRLFGIVYLLLEKKRITAKELAEKFEVSTRTIFRDLDILSSANIPIYCNKGKGGGIELLEDFVFDKTLLSDEEQKDILSALQGLKEFNIGQEKNTFDKMSQIFHRNSINWLEIDVSDWGFDTQKENTFEMLKKAILNQQVITFFYNNTKGEQSKREVEPLQICFKDKSWYLVGYCKEKQAQRIFKIKRMENIELLNMFFKRELKSVEEKSNYELKTIRLELEISKRVAYRVYDEFQRNCIQKNENGDFLVKVEYPESDWIYGYLLSFGENIKIISPKEVKEKIKEQAKLFLKNN